MHQQSVCELTHTHCSASTGTHTSSLYYHGLVKECPSHTFCPISYIGSKFTQMCGSELQACLIEHTCEVLKTTACVAIQPGSCMSGGPKVGSSVVHQSTAHSFLAIWLVNERQLKVIVISQGAHGVPLSAVSGRQHRCSTLLPLMSHHLSTESLQLSQIHCLQ